MTLLRINNRILKKNGIVMAGPSLPPAPVLPPYTIRLKFMEGVTPTFSKGTAVQVPGWPGYWDLTYNNPDWTELLEGQDELKAVISSNTSGVTSMAGMFGGCTALERVFQLDTSSVTNAEAMFYGCESLATIPLFDTSSMTDVDEMFSDCHNVQSGALAIYNQMASQANPPSSHLETFYGCGSNTTTGAAELAQIPSDWK